MTLAEAISRGGPGIYREVDDGQLFATFGVVSAVKLKYLNSCQKATTDIAGDFEKLLPGPALRRCDSLWPDKLPKKPGTRLTLETDDGVFPGGVNDDRHVSWVDGAGVYRNSSIRVDRDKIRGVWSAPPPPAIEPKEKEPSSVMRLYDEFLDAPPLDCGWKSSRHKDFDQLFMFSPNVDEVTDFGGFLLDRIAALEAAQ